MGCASLTETGQPSEADIQIFEQAYPVYEFSLRAYSKATHKEILRLYSQNPMFHVFFSDGIRVGSSAANVVNTLWQARKKISDEIWAIRNRLADQAFTAEKQTRMKACNRCIKKKNDSSEQLLGMRKFFDRLPVLANAFGTYDSRELRFYQSAVARAKTNPVITNEDLDFQLGFYPERVQFIWSQIRVAMCVPNFIGLNVSFQNEQNTKTALTQDERDLFVDLSFLDGSGQAAWGVVKTFRAPVSKGSAALKATKKQLEKLKKLRAKLYTHPAIYLFFIQGIYADAKQELESMGISVQGAVISH